MREPFDIVWGPPKQECVKAVKEIEKRGGGGSALLTFYADSPPAIGGMTRFDFFAYEGSDLGDGFVFTGDIPGFCDAEIQFFPRRESQTGTCTPI